MAAKEIKKQTLVWLEDDPKDLATIKNCFEKCNLEKRVDLTLLLVKPQSDSFEEVLKKITDLGPEVTVFTDGLEAKMSCVVNAARANVPQRRVGYVTTSSRNEAMEVTLEVYKLDFYSKWKLGDRKAFKDFVLGEGNGEEVKRKFAGVK